MKNFRVCIGIPTYNGSKYFRETLSSVFNQRYQNFTILINDDCSTDNTLEIAKQFPQEKMQIYQNKKNVGCSINFQILRRHVRGDIVFLLCQDDILLPGALEKTVNAFQDARVGAVTRPYYWFDKDTSIPIRAVLPLNKKKDESLFLPKSTSKQIIKVIESSGQASGLAFRIKDLTMNFHPEIFVTHVYPLLDIAKKYRVVFLKDMTVAVRIASSQSRGVSGIYDVSPTQSWMNMLDSVFKEKECMTVRNIAKNYMLQHYVGLIQIKNYSTIRYILREIAVFIQYRKRNVLNPKFWFYVMLTLLTPRFLLRRITDTYKRFILSRTITV